MNCPRCNTDNKEGARFCHKCGTSLHNGGKNTPRFSFGPVVINQNNRRSSISFGTRHSGTQTFNVGNNPSVRSFNAKGISFNMIKVEGGKFYMGVTHEMAQHYRNEGWDWKRNHPLVTLNTFYIGETVVTQGLWKAVMKETEVTQADWQEMMGELCNPSAFIGDDLLPVERITPSICQDFINKLSSYTSCKFRLPTEEEWEFAARGGNLSKGYEHSGGNIIDEIGWFDEKTHRVKMKRPNELGIYDMSGNVWELCSNNVLRGRYYEHDNILKRISFEECPHYWRDVHSFIGFRLALSEH